MYLHYAARDSCQNHRSPRLGQRGKSRRFTANRGDSPQIAVIHRDDTLWVIRSDSAVISLRPSRDKDQLLNYRKTPRIAVIGIEYYI